MLNPAGVFEKYEEEDWKWSDIELNSHIKRAKNKKKTEILKQAPDWQALANNKWNK